jgi:hypothetical protein
MTKKRARTERRERERAMRKIVRDKQALSALDVGGSAERPIEVTSSSVIEVRARGTPCPLCGGSFRVEEQTAESIAGRSLRTARVTCTSCGIGRTLWFRIGSPLAN